RGFNLNAEPASRTLAHRSRVFWGRSNSSAMASDLARRVYRLHILPAPSSLNPSSHQDRLKRSSSEDARVADQQEPSPCPRQKHSVTRPNTVSSRPSTPTPTVDSKPTLPSTEFRAMLALSPL